MTQPKAAFKVTLDGKDLTARIAPRLLSLQLTEKRGKEADTLELEVHDHDGAIDIPKKGAKLKVALGWEIAPEGMQTGLVDKGSFTVTEAEFSGPPDKITIRANSADMGSGLKTRREITHRDTNIGAIFAKIASDNGLEAKVHPDLAICPVALLDQDGKSDMAIVRQLGKNYDAAATVKDGKLLFLPVGKGETAGGKALTSITLTRDGSGSYSYRRNERSQYDEVEARYHDKDTGERKSETHKVEHKTTRAGAKGSAKTSPKKRLKKIYPSKERAAAAAKGHASKVAREGASFDYSGVRGRPDLYPERKVKLTGFKPEIDAMTWTISEAIHKMDGSGGYSTDIKMDAG